MSVAEKYSTLIEKIPQVHEAGKNSMLEYHPEVTVSGSIISLNDVSELPHDVKCKISGVDDPTSIKVNVCGKNLFDSSKLLLANGWKEENGVYFGLPSTLYNVYNAINGKSIVPKFKPSTQYVLTFIGYAEVTPEKEVSVSFRFQYADGSYNSVNVSHTTENLYTLISEKGKTVVGLFSSYGYNVTSYLRDIQVVESHLSTHYEPYNGQTLTPSADGTVEGITSVSPYMNVFADTEGVNIEATYRKSKGYEKAHNKPFLDTRNIESHSYMFINGARIDLLDKFDFSNIVESSYMFRGATTVTKIPVLGTKSVASFNMFAMGCKALETIEGIDFSSATNVSSAFMQCSSLKNITVNGTIPISITFSACPLTLASATSVLNALVNYAGTENEGTYSITFSSTTQAYLDAAGTIFNGMNWKTYIGSIGWAY